MHGCRHIVLYYKPANQLYLHYVVTFSELISDVLFCFAIKRHLTPLIFSYCLTFDVCRLVIIEQFLKNLENVTKGALMPFLQLLSIN